MHRLFLAATAAIVLLFISHPAQAQWHHHGGYFGGFHGPVSGPYYGRPGYSVGYGPRGGYYAPPPAYYGPNGGYYARSCVGPTCYVPPTAYIPRPVYYTTPSYGYDPMYSYPQPLSYAPPIVVPQPAVFATPIYTPPLTYAPPVAPVAEAPIPPSTYRVDTDVTVCRTIDDGEVCGWTGTVEAEQRPVAANLLLQIARARLWGNGLNVVAHFTRHANGTIDANITANPIDSRWRFDQVRGVGDSTAQAMQDALDSLNRNAPTTIVVH